MRSTAFSRSGSKVMRSGFFAIGFAVAFLIAANAQAANSWGLPNEEIVRFEAKVVDVLCELSGDCPADGGAGRSEEHTSELQSLMRISYAVFCLKKKKQNENIRYNNSNIILSKIQQNNNENL